jgi:prolyl-tRNA synthetase
VKFKDADLIGFPVQVVVGRRASEGFVEVKVRATGARVDVAIEGLATQLGRAIRAARDGSALHLELGA